MKAELQKELFEKYPKIFRQKDLSMRETCMCWGIATGDGWFWLIDNLCSELQWDIDKNGYPQIEATQVKEKFGTLRFYYTHSGDCSNVNDNDYKRGAQDGTISFAEYLSGGICEDCGSTNGVSQTEGWMITLCKNCMEKRNYI